MNTKKRFKINNLIYTHILNENPLDANLETHTHEGLELYYFASGNAVFYIEGNSYKLSAGDVVLIRENESHFLKILSDTPYERVVINFPPNFLSNIDPEQKLMDIFYNRELGCNNIIKSENIKIDLMSYFMQIENAQVDYSKMLTLSILLSHILLHINMYYHGCVKEESDVNVKDKFSTIIAYVNENIISDLSIASISEHFYISPSYLNRCFKEKTGYTVWQYIITKRLILAQACIKNGKSASQAAQIVGFNDYTAFYKQYKKHFGYPPMKTQIN